MSYYVSAVSNRARNNWPKIFEKLGIFIPPNHRHGPCPCCGGKDCFRMDDLEGRGTWFCNQCGAGDGLDSGFPLLRLRTGCGRRNGAGHGSCTAGSASQGKITGFEYGIAY